MKRSKSKITIKIGTGTTPACSFPDRTRNLALNHLHILSLSLTLHPHLSPFIVFVFIGHSKKELPMLRQATITLAIAAALTTTAGGQTRYKQPPADVVAVIDAPVPPRSIESPTHDALLLVEMRPYPPIEFVAQPVRRLAGLRINPRAGSAQRVLLYTGLTVLPLDGSPARHIEIPAGSSIQSLKWSHDGKKIAFSRDLDDGVELWVADAVTGRARPIAGGSDQRCAGRPNHLAKRQSPCAGSARARGSRAGACGTAGARRPQRARYLGRKSQMATFQDLLANPNMMKTCSSISRPARLPAIDTETGAIERIGRPHLITLAELSPDEKYLLVSLGSPPVLVTACRTSTSRARPRCGTMAGQPVATVADLPITDDVPRQGVPTGPRSIEWQPLHDARLVWAEALDGGDPREKVPSPRQGHGPGGAL